MIEFTIKGNTPSQKNGKQIVYNKATGRRFVVSNKNVLRWHENASVQLRNMPHIHPSHYPVRIMVVFYRDTDRKYDLDNAFSSVADALVHAGIIEDDNMSVIRRVVLEHGGKDKLNPRAEVTLL